MVDLIKKYVLIVILFLVGSSRFNLFSQIVIQNSPAIENMVEMIIGEGVQYENVSYQGDYMARAGFVNGNSTNLGLDEGIILSTGKPTNIPGPNDNCNTYYIYLSPGHPLLTSITSAEETMDASILEFDIIPESDTLRFHYVFGSEDYSVWIMNPYTRDVFGCFITGPDPAGGYYVDKNIALVPETDLSITAFNINNGFTDCGVVPTGPCNNCEYYIDNTNGASLEFNGFTVVLDAWVKVIPCETYHVFLGIADGSSIPAHTSGVFIETSDYVSPELDILVELAPSDTTNILIEGCGEAIIQFKLPSTEYSPATVSLDYSGSAVTPTAYPDGDFEETLPTEITIEEGEDTLNLYIQPVKDGIFEGDEILQIVIEYSLTCPVHYDTIELIISDYIEMSAQSSPDTNLCQGEEVELWVNVENGIPPYSYNWEGLPYANDTIFVSPSINSWYYVNVTDQCQDTIIDSIYIEVNTVPQFSLGTDTTICTGDEILLQPEQGNYPSYLWSTGDTTSSITVNQPGTYTLTVTNQCGESVDDISIEQWPYPDPNLGTDLQLCYGEIAQLQAAFGFLSYTWQDNSTQDFYPVTQSGLYYVEVEDIHGCTGTDTVVAEVASVVSFPSDTVPLCEGETVTLNAGSEFDFYTWSTGQADTNSISISQEGWYKVEVYYYYGCESEDSVYAEVFPEPDAMITGPDFLCEGDTLWLYGPEGKYQYYWNNALSTSSQLLVTMGGDYTLTLTNACGEDSDTKTINTYDLPDVDLGNDQLLFPGEVITLDAGSYDSIIWNGNVSGQYYTVSYADIDGKDSIWVDVFDGFCKNSDNIIIEVFNVKVPSLITPNGDGANDLFLPMENWSGITHHHIMVFNRWGEKLWESDNFTEGWDGRNNGKTVANGTYFWILEVWYGQDNVKKDYKGSLTVLGSGG